MVSWTVRACPRSVGSEAPASAPISASPDRPRRCRPGDGLQQGRDALAGVQEAEVADQERRLVGSEQAAHVGTRHGRRRIGVEVAADRHDPASDAGAGLLKIGKVREDGSVAGLRQQPIRRQAQRTRLWKQVWHQEIVEGRDDARPGHRRPHDGRQKVDRAAQVVGAGLELDVEQRTRAEPGQCPADRRPGTRVPGRDPAMDRHADRRLGATVGPVEGQMDVPSRQHAHRHAERRQRLAQPGRVIADAAMIRRELAGQHADAGRGGMAGREFQGHSLMIRRPRPISDLYSSSRRRRTGVVSGGRAIQVLVVDDEPNLVELVQGYLEREGYRVLTAADGTTALALAQETQQDLIVLDLMLPGLDGLEVCRRLRQFSDAYVLMLTARAEEVDKVVGLSVGADDYLTKPFSPRELVARVKAMLRRPRSTAGAEPDPPPPQRVGDLVVDRARHEVLKRGSPVPLTARELALLATLAAHPGRVFTRSQLLERVWGSDFYDDHVVEVHVGNLRRKLEDDPSRPRWVQTVRGVGYRLADQAE